MPKRERRTARPVEREEPYEEEYEEEELAADVAGRPARRPFRPEHPEQHTDEGTGSTRLHGELAGSEEGIAGEGVDQSGTLPGSTGGVTGGSGHSGGTQSPGAKESSFSGISPEEAERLRREGGRRKRE